jgi:glycosyltransferase involved in cell wall biosynthesis
VTPAAGSDPSGQVAINARAAVREQIGGVERLAREMARRLPALRPQRYRVIRPPRMLAHRAGHLWEQSLLPLRAARAALTYSPANLAPLLGTGNVVVIHDVAALRRPEAYSRAYVAYQRRLLPLLARRARLVITVSEFSRGELVEVLGLDPAEIAVIPEGVDERFTPEAVERVARVSERYGVERPYVLTVGTVSGRKNLGLLARAAGVLAERGTELVLAGSDRGYLRAAAVPLRRLGYVAEEDLPALYAGALALALPSRYEGFGLPCLEAMATGTPVVAARCGALPETVGEAGVLLDPDDAKGFADALVELIGDESARERLTAAGLRRAAGFSWSRTAELTDETMTRLLDGSAPIQSSPCCTGNGA